MESKRIAEEILKVDQDCVLFIFECAIWKREKRTESTLKKEYLKELRSGKMRGNPS